jgi:hypothetical protein
VLDRQAGRDVVDAVPIVGWWRLAAVVEDHASRRRVGGRHDGRRGQGAVLDVARHAAPSAPALVPTTIRAGSSRTGASTSSAPYSYAPRAPPPDSTIPIVPSVASTLSRPDRARGRRPTGTHADRRRCLRGFDPAIQRFVHGGSPSAESHRCTPRPGRRLPSWPPSCINRGVAGAAAGGIGTQSAGLDDRRARRTSEHGLPQQQTKAGVRRRAARTTPARPVRACGRPAVRCSLAPRCPRVEGLAGLIAIREAGSDLDVFRCPYFSTCESCGRRSRSTHRRSACGRS